MREPFPLMSAQGEHFSRLTFFVGRNDSDRGMMVKKENNDGGNDAERLTVVPVPNCPRTSSKSGLAAASRGQGLKGEFWSGIKSVGVCRERMNVLMLL